jgi:hypothetical protein
MNVQWMLAENNLAYRAPASFRLLKTPTMIRIDMKKL